MPKTFEDYTQLTTPLPTKNMTWNMYGPGLGNIGKNGKLEVVAVPEPDADQLLVRVDAVGMCFSDVKLIKLGSEHPKIYHRDLKNNPTRVGHEASLTVIKVGKNLVGEFHPRQRLAIQPDIYKNQINTAYGYAIPGGLIQFHLVGPEILRADDTYVNPIEGSLSYAESALTEPWACVEAAYTQRRRLQPKTAGLMWIVGQPGDQTVYQFSHGLNVASTVVLTDVSPAFKALVMKSINKSARVIEKNQLKLADYPQFNEETTGGKGFDDIVLLAPVSAAMVTEAVKMIASRGTFNVVGTKGLDGPVSIDAGRMHYHYTTYIGNPGPDVAGSYGEKRNRCDLKAGGTLVVVGGAGPMGQMHVQRALEMENGPKVVIASDLNNERLAALGKVAVPIAHRCNRELILVNPNASSESLAALVERKTGGRMADDVVICVPSGPLMEESARVVGPEGMLVFFAGAAIGTIIKVNINDIFLHNMQLTGTSGSTMNDQRLVIQKTMEGKLSPILSVAAVGGIEAALDGLNALMTGKYTGKVVIFPQLSNLPLIGLAELKEKYPDIGEKLGENNSWTVDAEKALIEKFWFENQV
jgi:threonine dehydrogenase-like Zn-dependent dehydrogenase